MINSYSVTPKAQESVCMSFSVRSKKQQDSLLSTQHCKRLKGSRVRVAFVCLSLFLLLSLSNATAYTNAMKRLSNQRG